MNNNIVDVRQNAIKHWYLSLILGIIFILAGVWVLRTPLESYLALSVLFSVTFFVSGVFETFYYVTNRGSTENWGWGLTGGIIDLLFGAWLIASPQISVTILPFVVGFILLYRSSTSMAVSFDLKSRGVKDWWWLLIIGILGLLFSYMMIFNPFFGGMTIVVWTALSLITIGLFKMLLSFKLKHLHDIA